MKNDLRTLLVMESNRRRALIEHLKGRGAFVLVAGTCLEARRILLLDPSIELLVTDTTLSDGNWVTLVTEVVPKKSTIRVVVCSNSTLNNVQLPVHVEAYGACVLPFDPCDWQELDRIIEATVADRQAPRPSDPRAEHRLRVPVETRGGPVMSAVKELICAHCHVIVPLQRACTHCGAPLPESDVTRVRPTRRERSAADRDSQVPVGAPAA